MKRGPARQFDGTESEWKYRGRTESEDTEPQPLSAPSGLAAQKNEGFQRFYRAVVSPTHVRVTAGGRIVPNNRAPPSPTSKWSTGKTNFDGNRVHQRGHSEQSACSLPQGPFGTYPAMYPGFIPGINPAMAPGTHHYPMIPWHLGMNLGGGFGIPIASANKPSPSKPTFNKPKDSPRNDKHSESGVPDKASFPYAPVSDQFDHNRSAVYNGQWMIPPGGQLYPVAMATPHGFPGAPFAIPMMASRGMATNHAARSATGAHNQPAENDILGSTAKAVPGYAPPSKPPISSIRPSEITKRHLDILRARLKYLEDQLSYNKHQIDEKAVENDAQMVHQYIDQFEKNFDAQVSIEESQYQKHSQNKDLGEATPSNGGVVSKPSASSEARSHSGNHASSNSDQVSHSRLAGHKTDREKSGSRFNPGINSTKSVSAFVGWKEPSNSADTSDELNGKSTLPVGAAMAAPFQPRTGASSVTDRRPQPSQDQGTSNSGAAAGPAFASHGNQGTPYLVGYLPYGIRPDLAKDTDYSYTRPLTEDELRARHMYWGKAPRHLQKGLPKFDGKDFFPPSPVKDRSSDETSSMACSTGGVPPFIGADVECGLSTVNSSIDPFQGLSQPGQILTRNGPGHSTQSESLPRWEQGSTENLTATTNHSIPYAMRVGRSLDELNGGSQETAPTSSGSTKDKSSSDEADDDRELIFTGRKTMAKPVYVWNTLATITFQIC